MFVIMMLLLLPIDVDLHVAILAPKKEEKQASKHILSANLLVCLFSCRNVKLIKGEDNSLKVLAVLHPIDEVATHDVGLKMENCSLMFPLASLTHLIRKWIVGTEHVTT